MGGGSRRRRRCGGRRFGLCRRFRRWFQGGGLRRLRQRDLTRDRRQQVLQRRLRRRQDVEILSRLRQAAQRHDLEVLYQAVPRLGVVVQILLDHAVGEFGLLRVVEIDGYFLPHHPALRGDLARRRRQRWQQHLVKPIDGKEAWYAVAELLA